MKKLSRLFWLVTFMLRLGFHPVILAQGIDSVPRSVGMGRAGLALIDSLYPATSIAASSLTASSHFRVSFDRPFGIAELQQGNMEILHRFRSFNAVLTASSIAFDDYRESSASVGLSTARTGRFGRRTAIGVRMHASRIAIANSGKRTSFMAEAGWLYVPRSDFSIGGRVVTSFTRSNSRFDTPIRQIDLGVMFRASSWMRIVLDVQRKPGIGPALLAGMELQVSRNVCWRTGWNTLPGEWTTGICFHSRNLAIDFAFAKHQWLGWTSQVATTFIW